MPTPERQFTLDVPLFVADFRAAAVNQDSDPRTGTRLYNDLLFRGRFYEAAQRVHEGAPLRDIDRDRLGVRPRTVLSIHYFGEMTEDPQAMSLRGLREVIHSGAVDDLILTQHQRYDVRERILGEVIATKLTEVVLTTY